MATAPKKPTPDDVAAKLIEKLPAAVRDEVSTKPGSGDYVILRCAARSIGTARPASVKVILAHDGSAAQLAALSKVVAEAAKMAVEWKAGEDDE